MGWFGFCQLGAQSPNIQLPTLPHVTINTTEKSVDVDALVALHKGKLELVACTVGTKEHESVVAIRASAKHVHLMLVLAGAKEGNPYMREALDDTNTRWRDVPATGHSIEVSLVFEDDSGEMVEHPISHFIKNENGARYPDRPFLFAGSQLRQREGESPVYIADVSGNFITLSSFGDEVLCQPVFESHDNDSLQWVVDGADLPPIDSEVLLRLRLK